MALILDTRFLIAHCFPRSKEERERIKDFLPKIAKDTLMIPSIVVVEFIKIAGSAVGLEQAKIKLRLWIGSGAEIVPIDRDTAFLAGEVALRHRDAPIADVIISTMAQRFKATVVTDDPHFIALGVKTTWYELPKGIH
jgi:predicted nucleic acid-binding protein